MRLYLLIPLLLISSLLSAQEVSVSVSCQEAWPTARAVPVMVTFRNVPPGSFARFHQTFPLGFSVREAEVAGADFFRDNNQINFVWLDFPAAEVVQIQYLITPDEALSGSFRLTGRFDYVGSDGSERYTVEMPPKLIRLDPEAVVMPVESPVRMVTPREKVAESRRDITAESEKKVEQQEEKKEEKKEEIQVRYRVQVAIASLLFAREELEKRIGCTLSQGMTVLRSGNLYKYQSGSFEKYTEASRYLEELKECGVNDAFIVAYRNDEQIPVDQARTLEKSSQR
ncbi:MAG: hypothetical protein LC649_02360 [Bacteroidales bacterium]|nr:hypothetical protein [Bacteroidales bacterium]